MPPDLALLSTLIGSNYPCLELIFMVQKVFEPLKFDCTLTIHRFFHMNLLQIEIGHRYYSNSALESRLHCGLRADCWSTGPEFETSWTGESF